MPPSSDTDALLEQLFELPEAQWPEHLEALCREHPERAAHLRRRHGLLVATGLDAAPERVAELGVPERFGDYRLVRRLGSGGMGMVFAAEQCSLGREVAIKFVRPELTFSSFARERFRREIEAIAQLDHPGIVPILMHGETGGVPYYVMPLVHGASGEQVIQSLLGGDPRQLSGADLRRVLGARGAGAEQGADDGVFDGAWWQACVRMIRQAAVALDRAHRSGVVHRDVKPSNLLFTADGRALVVDFGLAHVPDDARITHSGAAPGSPAYMSPEQVRGRGIDARTDVYSLAVTLHHLLALRHPLPIDDSDALRAAILTGRREPLPAGVLPPELAIVLGAAMDLDPDRRHRTAEAFAADLQAVLEQRPIQARSLPRRLRVRRWMQRHPTATTAMVLGALLLTATPTLVAFGVAGERDRALEAEANASRSAYEANISAANAALRAGDRIEAERRLDACAQGLRGFEWRHLHQALSGSLREFPGHVDAVLGVAIRADASWMASVDKSGRVFVRQPLLDAAGTGFALPDRRPVEAVAIAADGRRVTVLQSVPAPREAAPLGPTVRVLDVANGKVVAERTSTKLGERVCIAADGDSLLVIDGLFAQQLDAFTLAPIRSVELAPIGGSPEGPIAFDGDWLFAEAQRALYAWHVGDGRGSVLYDAFREGLQAAAAAVRRGTAVFAVGGGLAIAEVEPLRVRNIDAGERKLTGVAMDASGDFVAAVGADHAFRAWSTATGRTTCQAIGRPAVGRAVAVASSRLLAVVGDQGGGLQLHGMFDANEHQLLVGHSGIVSTLTALRDGTLLSTSHEPAVRVWDPTSGAPIAASYEMHHHVYALEIAPGGRRAFASYADVFSSLRMPELAPIGTVKVSSWIRRIFATSDSRAVAVADDQILEIDVDELRVTASMPTDRVRASCSLLDGTRALAATDRDIQLWQLAPSLQHVATLPVPGARAIVCSRDGASMFTSEGDWLRRRRVDGGTLVWERVCAQRVSSLLLLPDESRIVTGHGDGSVSLWHPGTGVCVATLRAAPHSVTALAADPAGRWLAAGDLQAAVVLFRANGADESFATRLEQADTIAASWLDDRLRRKFGARSWTLAAVEAQLQLDARLRELMARAERLRSVMTWETLAEAQKVAIEPGLPAGGYQRALRLAQAELEASADSGIGHLLAVLAFLRLERWDDVLRQSEAALRGKRNGTEISILHAASAMALHRLGRRDDARAELARMESSLAEVQERDVARMADEARRLVLR